MLSGFIELFVACVAGYVVYRQESLEKSIKDVQKDLSDIKRSIPKRWTDKLFDRESD